MLCLCAGAGVLSCAVFMCRGRSVELCCVCVQVFRKKIKRAKPKADSGEKKGEGGTGGGEEEDSEEESDSDFLR